MGHILRPTGIGGLAAGVLERAILDASKGRNLRRRPVTRKGTLYQWAVMSAPAADAVYAWLLRSGWDSASFWCAVLGLDPDYFRQLAYGAVEERRRDEALARCERMGRILEALCGV